MNNNALSYINKLLTGDPCLPQALLTGSIIQELHEINVTEALIGITVAEVLVADGLVCFTNPTECPIIEGILGYKSTFSTRSIKSDFMLKFTLANCMLGKNFGRRHFEFFYFSQKMGFDTSCKLSHYFSQKTGF